MFRTAQSFDHYRSMCFQAVSEAQDIALANSDNGRIPSNDKSESGSREAVGDGVRMGIYHGIQCHKDGLFSTVYQALTPEGQLVALKVTTPSAMSPPHDSEREVRILKDIAGSCVIPLLDSYRNSGSQFVLVFPFKPIELEQLLVAGSVSNKKKQSHLLDMFRALDHLHSHGIIHRDIKPSNILLDSPSGPAYLADFGIAWSPRDKASEAADHKTTDVGTTSYRPPELLFGYTAYGFALDMWAAGCVVAETVTSPRRVLFDSGALGSDLALVQSIFRSLGTPNLDVWPEARNFPDWGKMQFHVYPPQPWTQLLPGASKAACDLVDYLIRFESSSRLTAAQAQSQEYFTATKLDT